MIRKILCICWFLLLSGCADKPSLIKGAEGVIYSELQHFDIKVKNNSTAEVQQQVSDIINELLPVSPDTQWIISYRLKQDINIVNKAVKQLKDSGVIPTKIKVLMVSSLAPDISLEVRQYYLLTSTCKPYSFEQRRTESGCFIDTLRLKQLVSPRTLINTVKEL